MELLSRHSTIYRWTHTLSSTTPQGALDERLRYSRRPEASQSSCARDAALAVAIQLNAGRIQRDVMTPRHFQDLQPLVRLLIQTIQGPWGLAPQEKLNSISKALGAALAQYDPQKFPISRFQGVQSLLDTLLQGLPQVSFTQVRTHVCCDDQLVVLPSKLRICSSIDVSLVKAGTIVGQSINDYFQAQTRVKASSPCSKGDVCVESVVERPRVLLDASSPTRLVVHFPVESELTHHNNEKRNLKVFDDIEIETFGLNGTTHSWYQVIGAIFVLNNDHFVVRWTLGSEKRSKRHIDQGSFSRVDSWWDKYRIPPKPPMKLTKHVLRLPDQFLPRVVTLIYQLQLFP